MIWFALDVKLRLEALFTMLVIVWRHPWCETGIHNALTTCIVARRRISWNIECHPPFIHALRTHGNVHISMAHHVVILPWGWRFDVCLGQLLAHWEVTVENVVHSPQQRLFSDHRTQVWWGCHHVTFLILHVLLSVYLCVCLCLVLPT